MFLVFLLVEALVAKSEHAEWGVRLVAVEVLGWLDAETLQVHAAALVTCLGDAHSHVRRAACEALNSKLIAQCAEQLSKLLEDPEWHVRRAAVEAVGKLDGEAILEEKWQSALEACRTSDPDDRVRRAAAEALK